MIQKKWLYYFIDRHVGLTIVFNYEKHLKTWNCSKSSTIYKNQKWGLLSRSNVNQ